jgi:hypothetical protein
MNELWVDLFIKYSYTRATELIEKEKKYLKFQKNVQLTFVIKWETSYLICSIFGLFVGDWL